MLRHSAAPLAISIFLLSACSSGDEPNILADEIHPAGEDVPSGSEPDSTEIPLTITSPPDGPSKSTTNAAKPRTLAAFPENLPWTMIARSPDGRGGFIGLRLSDNGNGDADHFTYDEDSGELSLVAPVDFERPVDADGDSVFELQMIAYEYPSAPPIDFSLDVTDSKEIFEDRDTVLIIGADAFGGLGRNVISLGDVDQDGRPDIALAAPGQHTRDRGTVIVPADANYGNVFFFSGEALSTLDTLNLHTNLPDGVWHLEGGENEYLLGYSMTSFGDLTGDGAADVALARNETEMLLLSSETLAQRFAQGGVSGVAEVPAGTITLPNNYHFDPLTLAPLGDLNGDDQPDLAICMRRGLLTQNSLTHLVGALSGAGLQDAMVEHISKDMTDLFDAKQGGYFGRSDFSPYCGALTSLGDISGDGLTDVGIQTPEYAWTGAWLFNGEDLLSWMENGVRDRSRTFQSLNYPITALYDNVHEGWQGRMLTPLGDVTGDQIDDFAFSWNHYGQADPSVPADPSAFIIKGGPDLFLAPRSNVPRRTMDSLVNAGQAIAVTPPAGSNNSPFDMFAMSAPENGLHAPVMLVRYGQRTLHSVRSEDLPAGGTPQIAVPVNAAGSLVVPNDNIVNFSPVYDIGDLNQDGYGDLAIAYTTADTTGPGQYAQDGGMVWLVSGKAVLEARERGEVFDLVTEHPWN
ncbi:MAG: hypothetical protein AAFR51_07885 [Pseudomonadota bacterium]